MWQAVVFLVVFLSTPQAAPAAQAQDPLRIFAAYSVFMVANANCPDLFFSAGRLHKAMFAVGGQLHWSERRIRQQAEAHITTNVDAFGQNAGAFCRQASMLVEALGPAKLASEGLLLTRPKPAVGAAVPIR